VASYIAGAVVGRVVDVRDHPRGDLIWLAQVDIGNDGPPMQIVFGGETKVKVGDLVPVAPPGARIREQTSDGTGRWKKVRRRRFRGEESHGMLCSLDELGWLPGGPDEVATLHDVEVGRHLEEVPPSARPNVVTDWARAAEAALGNMVDELLNSPPRAVDPPSDEQPGTQ
jgi:tRNA-binding EMAP/Myf-like protein